MRNRDDFPAHSFEQLPAIVQQRLVAGIADAGTQARDALHECSSIFTVSDPSVSSVLFILYPALFSTDSTLGLLISHALFAETGGILFLLIR